jgi:GNAT superfamily N-acetyltransferase
MTIHLRLATSTDAEILGRLNQRLIQDEGHRNSMDLAQLQERMRGWLEGEYAAAIFETASEIGGYALYREDADKIHLRQFFVDRPCRRRGMGREAFGLLRRDFWPASKRLTVEVLCANETAVSFWRAVGFDDYSLSLEILPS